MGSGHSKKRVACTQEDGNDAALSKLKIERAASLPSPAVTCAKIEGTGSESMKKTATALAFSRGSERAKHSAQIMSERLDGGH
jgi:hypothetical protein